MEDVQNDQLQPRPAELENVEGSRSATVNLANRLTLRISEVADVLGISVRKVRSILPALPHFREGNVPLIPVEGLRRYVEERAKDRTGRTGHTVGVLSARRDH